MIFNRFITKKEKLSIKYAYWHRISNFSNKVGFVVGNEGNGVSENIKSIISNKISLPMENNVESLNATVAGSVIMYQIYSKLNNK